jgi:hypothetical protein
LALLATTAALSYLGVRQLGMDADLAALLPENAESVRTLRGFEREMGGGGFLTVVLEGEDLDTLREVADALAPQLEAIPDVRYVQHRQPVEFFDEHALYWLDTDQLQEVRRRLERRERWERQRANPLFVDLGDRPPPPLELDDILADTQERYEDRFGQLTTAGPATDPLESHFVDARRGRVFLFVKPRAAATDVAFAHQLVAEVEEALSGFHANGDNDGVEVSLTGRFKKRVDQDQVVRRDVALLSTVAFFLMIGFIWLHFRRLTAVAFLFAPLSLGLLWTFALAGFAIGTLNIITVFLGAILLGLGIDHGIHLVERYATERSAGKEPEQALRAAFRHTGRAVLSAGLTTAAGFVALAVSDFRAFREFAVISAGGMMMVVLAYYLTLPILVSRFRWRAGRLAAVRRSRVRFTRVFSRFGVGLAVLSLIGVVGLSTAIPGLHFNTDLRALEGEDMPSYRLDREVNQALGYSQSPMAFVLEDPAQEPLLAQALRQRQTENGAGSGIQFVLAPSDLIPPDQVAKRAILDDIAEVLAKVDPAELEPADRERYEAIAARVDAQPFSRQDLPIEAKRRLFGPAADANRGVVWVYPSIKLSDGRAVRALAAELSDVRLADGTVHTAAGDSMIWAEILEVVSRQALPVLGLSLGMVFLVLLVLLRRVGRALLCTSSAVMTLVALFGLMPLVGLELNYLNMVILPVIFGIGVDGAIHIDNALRRDGSLSMAVSQAGRAVAASILTTALGFGAPILAHQPGLRSFGELALLGLAVNLLVTLVALPAFLEAWARVRRFRRRQRLASRTKADVMAPMAQSPSGASPLQ